MKAEAVNEAGDSRCLHCEILAAVAAHPRGSDPRHVLKTLALAASDVLMDVPEAERNKSTASFLAFVIGCLAVRQGAAKAAEEAPPSRESLH